MAGRAEQRAKAAEAVGDDLTRGYKLGERLLDLRAEETRAIDDLVEEGCAVLADEIRNFCRSGTDRR
jgi:hypothetical protein